MAAFSYQQQHHPFLLDSIFLPNSTTAAVPIKMSEFTEEGNVMNSHFLSQFSPQNYKFPAQGIINVPIDAATFESSCVDHNSSSKVALCDNEPASSVTKNQSTVTSTVVDNNKLVESGEQVTQSAVTQIMDRKRKSRNNGSSSTSAQSKDPSEVKSKKQKKCNGAQKAKEEKNPKDDKKNQKKVPEEPPKDYIHVRARRGQATDSHSLAERVRREKISERMKILQKLVPGCDKVTGKALMLDEIINYVQSLQNQVEFLSMKLASVSPIFYDSGMDQLDAFMVRPDQRFNSIATSVPMQSVPQCSPTQLTAFANTTTTTTAAATAAAAFGLVDNYPIFDSAAASSLLLQQGQRSIAFSQDNSSLLWDVEEQKQKFLNPTGFTNNLFSFH